MGRPKRFNYLNPPIDGNYSPPSGMWTNLNGLVALARQDVGVVKEVPNESNSGPLLAPMWEWVRFPPGPTTNWCAAYQVWVYGRYFKSMNLVLDPTDPTKPPINKDPQVIKGIHALRQQFARLGPANSSRLWKGRDRYSTLEGHDPRWVWFTLESVINGEIIIRAGDLVYFNYTEMTISSNMEPYEIEMRKNENLKMYTQIYNGNYNGTGHVAMCTGESEIDSSGKVIAINTIQGNIHNRAKYSIGNSLVDEKLVRVSGDLIVGFLRYIGNFQGEVENACNIDFSKYIA